MWVFHISFHWYLRENKTPQVSRTLLSILVNFTCCLVCIVSVLLSLSSPHPHTLFSRHLMAVPRAPTIIYLTVMFIFISFFSSLTKSRYWSIFSFSFIFIQWLTGKNKFTHWHYYYQKGTIKFSSYNVWKHVWYHALFSHQPRVITQFR